MTAPCAEARRISVRSAAVTQGSRIVAEETPVAMVYDGSTHAVLMATPADLHDFALGFSLTEGVIEHPSNLIDLDVIEQADGLEIRMWLAAPRAQDFRRRRRALIGLTGCGLCGVESLAEAARPPLRVAAAPAFSPDELSEAIALLDGLPLGAMTRAVHAAGFWTAKQGLVAVREDVGRHNALDKLAGALLAAEEPTSEGMLLLTSRVSVEMVQKAARMGVGVLAALSAPTALALRVADGAGITLAAIARQDGFEVFTHPSRLGLA